MNAQIQSATDTIQVSEKQNFIQLDHPFVIESSVQIYRNDIFIKPNKIDVMNGTLEMPKGKDDYTAIITYDYLTEGLPLSVGPKWKSLPSLNLEDVLSDTSTSNAPTMIQDEGEEVFTSGSIYRKLTISPLGGSDFSGGLQMQLNGRLAENLYVSGVLTDRNLPIQPEGTTREIVDLDQVYLSATHPNFTVNAGDIIYNYSHMYSNINRKLVGLNSDFNNDNWIGSGVYASSNGEYQSIEIKGRDGDQGPYQLFDVNGDRDIIILSGTEKIWVDGKKLIRGQNYDYTIDYSQAEIIFTPKVLIHSDSDIFIEFQYSNFLYDKGFTGGTLTRELGKKGSFSLGIFHEGDQSGKEDWSQDILDSLESIDNGKIRIGTAILASEGDYVSVDSIYVYDPDSDNMVRYTVAFEYDPEGTYRRQISSTGKIYYEFVPPDERNMQLDLYSPHQTINAPKSHQYGFISTNYRLGEKIGISGTVSRSGFDLNSMNTASGSIQEGFSHRFSINADTLKIGSIGWTFSLSDWYRSDDYVALGRENDVMQPRLWNLDSTLTKGVRESNLKSVLMISNIGESGFEFARLNFSENQKDRLQFNQQVTHPLLQNSFLNYLTIDKPVGSFSRTQGRFQINSFNITPFIRYLGEDEFEVKRFKETGGGFNLKFKQSQVETGLDRRENETFVSAWENESNDIIGFMNYKSKSKNGWNQNIIIKKRVKSFENNIKSYDYALAKIFIAYSEFLHPVNWELQLKTEESFSEKRAIVYDSVGTGLGQYRYDLIFNTYVSDPNGAYLAYTVPTGDRFPTTVLEGAQRIGFDFGKLEGFPNMLIRSNSRLNYRGKTVGIDQLFDPNLNDSTLSRSRLNSRLEFMYLGKRRISSWLEYNQNLDGLDPRGNDLSQDTELGLDFNEKFSEFISIRNKGKIRKKSVESTISTSRERETEGWWNELWFQFRFSRSIDMDFGFLNGVDSGTQQGTDFSAKAYGMTIDGRFFFGRKGKLQTSFTWTTAKEDSGLDYVPPEALNGYPVGSGFRSNSRMQYFLNQSVSMIFSLNTIQDDRYADFITFQGEIRANF